MTPPDLSPRARAAATVTILGPTTDSPLASFDSSAPGAVPQLCELLKQPNPLHRKWAGETLIQLGAAAEPAVPLLAELLRHPDGHVCYTAAEVLSSLGPKAEPAVPALRTALADKDAQLQRWAALVLGEVGPAAREALPDLLKLRFQTTDLKNAAVAIVAAKKIDPEAGGAGVIVRDNQGVGERCIFLGHRACVQCVAFSPDGRLALSGSCEPASRVSYVSEVTVLMW
jgi:HEAT repeat protein